MTCTPQFQCISKVPLEGSISPSGTDAWESEAGMREYRQSRTASFSQEDSGNKYLSQFLEDLFL